jgi:hypothetical protein
MLFAFAVGCGGGIPVPNDQFAAAQNDLGRAEQGGAANVPDAKLHLQLAQENLSKAKALMDKDNKRALSLIHRASAEAELALALARESQAKTEAQGLVDQINKLQGK